MTFTRFSKSQGKLTKFCREVQVGSTVPDDSKHGRLASGVTAVSGGATRPPHPNPPPQGGRGPEKDNLTLASDPLPPCGGGLGWGGEDMVLPENSGTPTGIHL